MMSWDKMADYGIKISKPGYNVFTASIKNLILTSKAQQFKIHMKGTVNFTSDNQRINIAHNLSYTPSYLVMTKSSANSYYNWATVNNYIDGTYLSLLGNTNDQASYVIFKDLGA